MEVFIPIPGKLYKLTEDLVVGIPSYKFEDAEKAEALGIAWRNEHSKPQELFIKIPRGTELKFKSFNIKDPRREHYKSHVSVQFFNIPLKDIFKKNRVSTYWYHKEMPTIQIETAN